MQDQDADQPITRVCCEWAFLWAARKENCFVLTRRAIRRCAVEVDQKLIRLGRSFIPAWTEYFVAARPLQPRLSNLPPLRWVL